MFLLQGLTADENFDKRIVRGLLLCRPAIDLVPVQDLEISGADDPTVFAWADQMGRMLLTHDERSIPLYVYERMAAGQTIAGVIVASNQIAFITLLSTKHC